MKLTELAEEYEMLRYLSEALAGKKAELAISDAGGTTLLSAIFGEEYFSKEVRKAISLREINIRQQIREILDDDERDQLHHESLPEYVREKKEQPADPSLGIPKNDHRRCLTDDDGR